MGFFPGTRWQRIQSYATIGAWREAAYGDDDEFTLEDIDETVYAAIMLGLIWSPQIAMSVPIIASASVPLTIIEGAVLVGLGASYAIGGAEGAETYVDYITEPFTDPVSFFTDTEKTAALIQASDITLSLVNPLAIPSKMAGQWLGENIPWDEVFRNRWVSPLGVLPF